MRFGGLWRRRRPVLLPGAEEGRPASGLSHRLAMRLQNSRHESPPEDGRTLSSLIGWPVMPRWVRLAFMNDRPEPWRLDGAAVALSAHVGDGSVPLDAARREDRGLWRRVTFNAAASGQEFDPLDQPEGETFGVTLPGNPREDGRPVQVLSDWMPLSGPRRADGAGALLLVRAFAQGRMRYAGSVGMPDRGIGLVHAGHWFAGDATAPGFRDAAVTDPKVFACHGVQCIGEVPGATVLAIGDSIMHSSCSTGELSGFAVRAVAEVSRPGRPVTLVNEGYPGRNSVGYAFNGAWGLRTWRPQVALIQTWTQNEAWTREAADAAFARAIALVDLAREVGCVPILVTPAPVFAGQPEFEVHRQHALALVRGSGLPMLDLDALWGTGESPNAYRRDCGCGDGMHASDAGCVVAARALAPMLERWIAPR